MKNKAFLLLLVIGLLPQLVSASKSVVINPTIDTYLDEYIVEKETRK